jgi:outer membrane immunogenic protein
MNFCKLSRWLAVSVLVLTFAGPLRAFGQMQANENETHAVGHGVVLVALAKAAPEATSTLPAPPPPGEDSESRWNGAYIGISIGYGSGNADTFVNPLPTAAQFVNLLPQTLHPNPTGIVGGGQLGYNWQKRMFVIGVEGDFSGTNMNGTQTVTPIIQNNHTPFPGAGFVRAHQDTAWLGTIRPRLGVAFSRVLIYGTGGLAYGRVNNAAVTDFQPVGTTIYLSAPNQTKTGWTGGGGAEIAVGRGWSMRGEYLHYDLGNVQKIANPQISLPPFQVGYTWQITANLARFGLNYKF